MKYALFDWDNTIRRGFTLFSWIDFLCKQGILQERIFEKVNKIRRLYAAGNINHDDYAKLACELYAEEMKGIQQEKRDRLIPMYIKSDQQSLFSFANSLFGLMLLYNIKPVIISGAPEYLVMQYKDAFGIYDIYAFSEKYDNGICTGEVAKNYGLKKKRIVEYLSDFFGERPVIGFGDSFSDIPIFNMSKHAFCIVDSKYNNKSYGEHVNYISNKITGRQMGLLLGKILTS